MKPGTSVGRIPLNVFVAARAKATAGLANDVDAVNQYAAVIYAPTAKGTTDERNREQPHITDNNPNAAMNDRFTVTLGTEDQRRPRMELGLGVWSASTRRYYPMTRIRGQGGALLDQLDGRAVLIYIDLASATPAALFVRTSTVKVQNNDILLDDGSVRSGVLVDRAGKRRPMERPQQIFTRWYGFALTFPDSEIFGQ